LIIAGLLLVAGVAVAYVSRGSAPEESQTGAPPTLPIDLRSIAVLPLANRSALEEDAFFVDGIHDDIVTHLSKIEGLKVISRTSVMQYRQSSKPIREIAGELDVRTVLEGGVQRAGERVRVNVQLIDAESDGQLWAETYDEELTAANVFGIQSDIAQQIANALEATLAPEVARRIEQQPTESLEAYDLFLRGTYLLDKGTKEGYEGAIEMYEQAIGIDPEFARAYSGLAYAYVGLELRDFIPPEEGFPKARAAAERALSLDPDLAEAHTSLADVLKSEVRWEEAEREYRRALELNPGYAQAYARYAVLLIALGRFEESLAMFDRAAELDPRSLAIRANAAYARFILHDYEGAIDRAMNLLELEPRYGYGYYILANALGFVGRYEEAIAAALRALELEPEDLYNLSVLGYVYAQAGDREQALEIADQVEELGGSLKEVALIYGALGEVNLAFEYLERAYESDPSDLDLLSLEPAADPLRDDPRFDELVARLGLK
jgi:TolB-like protein/Flp pilus assembly protein TadD